MSRTPARRVQAPDGAGVCAHGGGAKEKTKASVAAAESASGTTHYFDELVRRELMVRTHPAAAAVTASNGGLQGGHPSQGLKSVHGMAGIKSSLGHVLAAAAATSAASGKNHHQPGLHPPSSVQSVLLFGPTGVGKTTVARALAAQVGPLECSRSGPCTLLSHPSGHLAGGGAGSSRCRSVAPHFGYHPRQPEGQWNCPLVHCGRRYQASSLSHRALGVLVLLGCRKAPGWPSERWAGRQGHAGCSPGGYHIQSRWVTCESFDGTLTSVTP